MKKFYIKTLALTIITAILATTGLLYQARADDNQDISASAKTFATEEANLVLSKAKAAKSEVEFISFLKQEVVKTMAVNYMGLWTLGANRNKFSKEQLQIFLNMFHNRLTEFYGSIIYQNKDQTFQFKSVTNNGHNKATVEFNIPLGKQALVLDWQIRKSPKENKLLVIDFVINGISFLQTKRSEYNALFQKSGGDPAKFISLFEETTTSPQAKQKEKEKFKVKNNLTI